MKSLQRIAYNRVIFLKVWSQLWPLKIGLWFYDMKTIVTIVQKQIFYTSFFSSQWILKYKKKWISSSFIVDQWVALGWHFHHGRVVVSLTYTLYLFSSYYFYRYCWSTSVFATSIVGTIVLSFTLLFKTLFHY